DDGGGHGLRRLADGPGAGVAFPATEARPRSLVGNDGQRFDLRIGAVQLRPAHHPGRVRLGGRVSRGLRRRILDHGRRTGRPVRLLGAYFAKNFDDDIAWRLSLAVAGAVSVLGALLWLGVDPGHGADSPPSKADSLNNDSGE